MKKCEHGLTTRECLVCASPKYAAAAQPAPVAPAAPIRVAMIDLLTRLTQASSVGHFAALLDEAKALLNAAAAQPAPEALRIAGAAGVLPDPDVAAPTPEPSDAQVKAADEALSAHGEYLSHGPIRAALRAAAGVPSTPNDQPKGGE